MTGYGPRDAIASTHLPGGEGSHPPGASMGRRVFGNVDGVSGCHPGRPGGGGARLLDELLVE